MEAQDQTLEYYAIWWRRTGEGLLHRGSNAQKEAWSELVKTVTKMKAPTVADLTKEQWVQLYTGHTLIFG